MMKIRDRVLVYSIIFSAAWHIFWLSAFSVVAVPYVKKPIKFSNVAFLGPILDKSVMNVNIKPQERTAAETRFIEHSSEPAPFSAPYDHAHDAVALPAAETLSASDEEEFTAQTVLRMDTDKLEPGRDVN